MKTVDSGTILRPKVLEKTLPVIIMRDGYYNARSLITELALTRMNPRGRFAPKAKVKLLTCGDIALRF